MFNFNYDPQRQGYDTGFWKTISGTPAVSGTKLRFNNAASVHFGDCLRGTFRFGVTMPNAPTNAYLTGGSSATSVIGTWNAVTDGEFSITINDEAIDVTALDFSAAADMDEVAAIIQTGINLNVAESEAVTVAWDTDHFIITGRSVVSVTSAVAGGSGTDISGAGATAFMDSDTGHGTATAGDDKYFGLKSLGDGGMVAFRIFGNQVRCIVISERGGETNIDIPWSSAWTTGEVDYRISWSGQSVAFYIGGSVIATTDTDNNPRATMSIFVDNNNADNLDFGYFDAQGIESFI